MLSKLPMIGLDTINLECIPRILFVSKILPNHLKLANLVC
jgi:hypothetical protein